MVRGIGEKGWWEGCSSIEGVAWVTGEFWGAGEPMGWWRGCD